MIARHGSAAADGILALTVATWFPSLTDSTKGRFVADQVAAIRAGGRADAVVVSFELARLAGTSLERRRQVASLERLAGTAIGSASGVFTNGGRTVPPGIAVARLPIPYGRRAFERPAQRARDRARALRTLAPRLAGDRPVVVHAHTGYPDGTAAIALADALRAPLIVTEHATFLGDQLAQPAMRHAYVRAATRAFRIVAVSETLAGELRSRLPDVAHKVVVVPNAIRMEDFRPAPLSERNLDELLYVGYRTESKGVDVLLRALAGVRRRRPATTLRLIGRSPSEEVEDGWRRLAAALGVGDAVRFEPPQLREGVAAAMAGAGTLVHASRRETFGVAPVEALASGLPVVAAATGPLVEILGDEAARLGALVPVGDVDALVDGILDVQERRLSFDPQALRNAVEDRFGGRAVAERIVDLYAEALGAHPAQGRAAPSVTRIADRRGALFERPRRPVLLVGFDTPRVAGPVAGLPRETLARLSLVCSAHPSISDLPGDLAVVTTADWAEYVDSLPERLRPVGSAGMVARAVRLVTDPLGAIARVRWRGAHARLRVSAIVRAAATMRSHLPGVVDVDLVCVDSFDFRAAEAALRRQEVRDLGVRLHVAPGGIRWLADREAVAVAGSARADSVA